MFSDPKHPVWKLAGVLIVGGLGLGYCHLFYANGVDPKDGGLIALVGGLTALGTKLFGGVAEK